MQNEEYRIKLKKGNERSLALIKSGMDIVVAIGLLQLAPKKVTPRVTGAFGFVTSLISCYQVFASSNLEFYLPYFSIAPEVSDVTHNCTERVSLIMISPSLLDFSLCIFFPLCYSHLHMGTSLRDSQTSFWLFWVVFRPFGRSVS